MKCLASRALLICSRVIDRVLEAPTPLQMAIVWILMLLVLSAVLG